ncbi:P44/Msp2 family outer membrane protein [Wolbachia endosymbiont of Drosophila aff. chauvacae BK-2020]|uniref:outer membrane protein n=1 Tax=unclassified Wolbachia TaxID=2640676 RepID=UPI0023AA13DE|nr:MULTISPECIES: P44/Msp2 family outer membrane protein [unclassified Wolbachia]MDE5060005.1 P44/Msp2 family outer membrane protein [Wolbachia endosymbiont of Drosophila burlai]MDE5063155.1 P44/Msp2 family outer membrane protein [Wolbachia endosymbiont of Drosophila chauvacae]MDU8908974.1 P44/Msp2 family outer membrane protein [Wolbachia endosymbiont of Drosophila bocqueti]WOE63372.1 P44/Msp2 family outer membrane protein [Wolbachia endosymbiont of Drosophila aff. chauvacae BK-2020]
MITRISITLFLIFISCVYFFITYISNDTHIEQVQPLKLETDNNKSVIRSEEVTAKEIPIKYQELESSPPSVFQVADQKNMWSRIADQAEPTKEKSKKLDFYVSANGGKVYHDNSEIFVKGIQEIGKRVLTLVESHYGFIIKNIVADEIKSIQQFDGKIDFQWFSSMSLGYYAGENGKIDFEAAYSIANIEDSNSPPVFDKSASIFAFLLNFYYNPSVQDTQFAPYIGLGIGPTIFRLKRINGSPQNSMPLNVPWFAYQIKLGVDYSIIPEIKTFLGYRYFSVPIPVAGDISTHNIEVGLIFNF